MNDDDAPAPSCAAQQQRREAGEERHVDARRRSPAGDVADVARRRPSATRQTQRRRARSAPSATDQRLARRRRRRRPASRRAADGERDERRRGSGRARSASAQLPRRRRTIATATTTTNAGLQTIQRSEDDGAEADARRRSRPAGCGRPGVRAPAAAPAASGRGSSGELPVRRVGGHGRGRRAASDLEQLGFLVLEQLVDLRRRTCWVSFSSSFSARRTSSSPASPSLTSLSSASLAWRRMLRIETLASSRLVPRDLDVLPAALLGQLRERRPG